MNTCPDCKGELEKGCILDHAYGGVGAQRYAKANLPESSPSMTLKFFEADFNDIRRVITYRCKKCNRLFQYAQNLVLMSSAAKNRNKFLLIYFGIVIIIVASVFYFSFR